MKERNHEKRVYTAAKQTGCAMQIAMRLNPVNAGTTTAFFVAAGSTPEAKRDPRASLARDRDDNERQEACGSGESPEHKLRKLS